MGMSFGVICKGCGHKYMVNIGGGFFFDLLHCDTCGAEKSVERSFRRGLPKGRSGDIPNKKLKPQKCGCGGRFSERASARCPVCKSPDYKEDPNGEQIMYDYGDVLRRCC